MFKGQHVAVTGAGAPNGIGAAIAKMFVDEGATVSISDLKSPEAVAADIGANAYVCDVSDEAAVQAFINDAQAASGPIDVFVSNAGLGFTDYPADHAAGADNKAWEISWQVNVMASVYAARALLPSWVERGSGSFVITASAAGLLCQVGSASYTATKHAAVGYAEAMAIHHKDDGINVHCICPQYVRTNMTKDMQFAQKSKDGLLGPEAVAGALKAAMRDGEFLVLSHPIVSDYFKNKAMNYDGYISGMAKLKAKLTPEDVKL